MRLYFLIFCCLIISTLLRAQLPVEYRYGDPANAQLSEDLTGVGDTGFLHLYRKVHGPRAQSGLFWHRFDTLGTLIDSVAYLPADASLFPQLIQQIDGEIFVLLSPFDTTSTTGETGNWWVYRFALDGQLRGSLELPATGNQRGEAWRVVPRAGGGYWLAIRNFGSQSNYLYRLSDEHTIVWERRYEAATAPPQFAARTVGLHEHPTDGLYWVTQVGSEAAIYRLSPDGTLLWGITLTPDVLNGYRATGLTYSSLDDDRLSLVGNFFPPSGNIRTGRVQLDATGQLLDASYLDLPGNSYWSSTVRRADGTYTGLSTTFNDSQLSRLSIDTAFGALTAAPIDDYLNLIGQESALLPNGYYLEGNRSAFNDNQIETLTRHLDLAGQVTTRTWGSYGAGQDYGEVVLPQPDGTWWVAGRRRGGPTGLVLWLVHLDEAGGWLQDYSYPLDPVSGFVQGLLYDGAFLLLTGNQVLLKIVPETGVIWQRRLADAHAPEERLLVADAAELLYYNPEHQTVERVDPADGSTTPLVAAPTTDYLLMGGRMLNGRLLLAYFDDDLARSMHLQVHDVQTGALRKVRRFNGLFGQTLVERFGGLVRQGDSLRLSLKLIADTGIERQVDYVLDTALNLVRTQPIADINEVLRPRMVHDSLAYYFGTRTVVRTGHAPRRFELLPHTFVFDLAVRPDGTALAVGPIGPFNYSDLYVGYLDAPPLPLPPSSRALSLYPNPTTGPVSWILAAPGGGPVRWQLYAADGRLVGSGTAEKTAGAPLRGALSTANLPAGPYFLYTVLNGEVYTAQLQHYPAR